MSADNQPQAATTAPVRTVLWAVIVRGVDPLTKLAELEALVRDNPDCTIVRKMGMEGCAFLFSVPENATNPLSEYMDSSPDVTLVKSTTITEGLAKDGAVEGSNIPFTPEDDNSD